MEQRTQQQPEDQQPTDAEGSLQQALSILNAGDNSDAPSLFREFSNAAQELVQSSNNALRQSNQKLSLLEAEVSALRARLEAVSENLASEREQRIAAEAQLTAQLALSRNRSTGDSGTAMEDLQSKLVQSADILREAGERQLYVVKRLEASLQAGDPRMPSTRTIPGITQQLLSGFLPALGGGVLGGGLVLLGMQVTGSGRQAGIPLVRSTTQVNGDQQKPATSSSALSQQSSSKATSDTLHISCIKPCWLDIREVDTKKILVYKNFSGNLSLPIGRGLDVFTGRGDLLKIKINEGPETTFSKQLVAERLILPLAN